MFCPRSHPREEVVQLATTGSLMVNTVKMSDSFGQLQTDFKDSDDWMLSMLNSQSGFMLQ